LLTVDTTTRRGRRMTEREKLEQEIYELTQIIGANCGALRSGSTSERDKVDLRRAVASRAARRSLLKEVLTSLPQSDTDTSDPVPA